MHIYKNLYLLLHTLSRVSQRGYYPDAIDKENQDTYSVNPSLNGDPNVHFFAVYDGHGRDGDKCSRYTR